MFYHFPDLCSPKCAICRWKVKNLLLFGNHPTTSSLTWATKRFHLFFHIIWITKLNWKQTPLHPSLILHLATSLWTYCNHLQQLLPWCLLLRQWHQFLLYMWKSLPLIFYIHLNFLDLRWISQFSASSLALQLRPWRSQKTTAMEKQKFSGLFILMIWSKWVFAWVRLLDSRTLLRNGQFPTMHDRAGVMLFFDAWTWEDRFLCHITTFVKFSHSCTYN